ncbi:exported hypothetical protein [Vibrio crassostreae]|nr:exported hypothetical protein [Vibrio crassostreae]
MHRFIKGFIELLVLLLFAYILTSVYAQSEVHESKILDLIQSIIQWLSMTLTWLLCVIKLLLVVSGKTIKDVMSNQQNRSHL